MKNNQPLSDLEHWFSAPRLSKYSHHPDPERLYIYNARITKELLVDIGHLEVLLRNAIDRSLSATYGTDWFLSTRIPLTHQAQKSIKKARQRTHQLMTPTVLPGKIIADVSFDFWRFLFTRTYQSTVWPKILTSLTQRVSRQEFENHLGRIYKMRNRCTHHEPWARQDVQREKKETLAVLDSIHTIAELINPGAADWIAKHSTVTASLAQRT